MISVKDLIDDYNENTALRCNSNLMPSDCLAFGETLCIVSNNNSLNTFILNKYIIDMLSINDIRIIYLDYSLNFIYSKFKAIAESQNFDLNKNFDKILYIPIPSPTQMLLVLDTLENYLEENKNVKVLVIDKMNFYPKWNFKGSELNTKLNRCYKGIKKLQENHNLLFIHTKTIDIDENNVQKTIQSHYKGFLDEPGNNNTVILTAFPSKVDYKIYATRFKKSFEVEFKSCVIKDIVKVNSYGSQIQESLSENLYNVTVNAKEDDECKNELEDLQKSILPSFIFNQFNFGKINENVTYY